MDSTTDAQKILTSLKEYLCMGSLKNLRGLNREWRKAVGGVMRERSIVKLVGGGGAGNNNKNTIQSFALFIHATKSGLGEDETRGDEDDGSPWKSLSVTMSSNYEEEQYVSWILEQEGGLEIVRLDYTLRTRVEQCLSNFLYELVGESGKSLEYFKLSIDMNGRGGSSSGRGEAASSRGCLQEKATGRDGEDGGTVLFPLYLPALREFELWNLAASALPTSVLMFPYQVLLGSEKLTRFYASSGDERLLGLIFRGNLLRQVVDLHLTDLSLPSFTGLARTKLGKLRSLGIQRRMTVADQAGLGRETLRELMRSIGEGIEEIAISGVGESITDHRAITVSQCGKLVKFLLDDWFGSLGFFQPERFPLLEKVYVINYHGPHNVMTTGSNAAATTTTTTTATAATRKTQVKTPHAGVVEFTLKGHLVVGDMIMKDGVKAEYLKLLSNVRTQFPSIRTFNLVLAELTVELVRAVISLFPSLETLRLTSHVAVSKGFLPAISVGEPITATPPSSSVSSVHNSETRTDLSSSKFQRAPCLLDLTALKTLEIRLFDRKDYLSTSVIRRGIAKIPLLETLTYNWRWQTSKDVRTVHKLLSHLREINIFYSGKDYGWGKQFSELKQLAESISQESSSSSSSSHHVPITTTTSSSGSGGKDEGNIGSSNGTLAKINIITDQDEDYLFSYRDKFNVANYQSTMYLGNTLA